MTIPAPRTRGERKRGTERIPNAEYWADVLRPFDVKSLRRSGFDESFGPDITEPIARIVCHPSGDLLATHTTGWGTNMVTTAYRFSSDGQRIVGSDLEIEGFLNAIAVEPDGKVLLGSVQKLIPILAGAPPGLGPGASRAHR